MHHYFYLLLFVLFFFFKSMIYTCRSQFANQICWSDLFQFIVLALKLNGTTLITTIIYVYMLRITNQLFWYDYTPFIVSIITLCYVYICFGVLHGKLFYNDNDLFCHPLVE